MEIRNNIVYGGPPKKVPNITLGKFIYQQLRNRGDNVVQVDVLTGNHFTCNEILEKATALAIFLKSHGVQVEDRVSIASENHPNYLVAMCATMFTGATWAPLNPAYTEREYRHMLEIYQPKVMFVTHRTEKLMGKIAPTLKWSMKLIEVDDEALDGKISTLNEILETYKNMVDLNTFEPVPVDDYAKRIAVILCSSGTTGFPKGVMLSHRNMLLLVIDFREPAYMDVRYGDRMLIFLPLFHGYAFCCIHMVIASGAIAYIMRDFQPVTCFKSIENYKITHLPLVPPVMTILAKHPMVPNYDFTSVREVSNGAAPLQRNVWEKLQRRTKMKYLRNGYGMTELTIVSNMSDRSSVDDNVGAPLPSFHCKIVDPGTGKILPLGETGEICFKGDYVMLGYYKNPKVTAETIDEDGWLHTGDLGHLNDKGLLYITGRIKELIKYKGFQVSPSEIESVMLSHPGIKDAAVLGKPDEVSGEIPMAFVVRQPGNNMSAQEIVNFTNGNLSPQKWLRGGVKFIESIPKTPSGKILRRELITMFPKL